MKRTLAALALALVAACDSDVTRPQPGDPPLDLVARINIQLGDTPAGQSPIYIITGEARAMRGDVPVAAAIDSVIISYRIAQGPWVRQRRTNTLPVSDALPFTAQAGQSYEVHGILYAHAPRTGSATVWDTDEWIAAAQGR